MKQQKMIVLSSRPHKKMDPMKKLAKLPPPCYIRKSFMLKKSGTVVKQSIICRKH